MDTDEATKWAVGSEFPPDVNDKTQTDDSVPGIVCIFSYSLSSSQNVRKIISVQRGGGGDRYFGTVTIFTSGRQINFAKGQHAHLNFELVFTNII